MPPRGRPRRPPRTDREEIKRNSDQWDEKVQAGLDAMFPIEPRPHPLTVEEIKSLFHAPSEEDLAAAAEKAHDAPPTPPPTESELKFDRELTEQLRDAGAPLPPSWVIDETLEAVPAMLCRLASARTPIDETGAEALRSIKELVGEPIRDPGGRGVKVRLLLFGYVEERFRAFAATCPTPADYQDTFLGVFVPFYNAAHGNRRRCVECGTVFALRTPADVETSRYCSEECGNRARNRGRERIGDGRSAAEHAAVKFRRRYQRHLEYCSQCNTGQHCKVGELLFIQTTTDALDRPRGDLPGELDEDEDEDEG